MMEKVASAETYLSTKQLLASPAHPLRIPYVGMPQRHRRNGFTIRFIITHKNDRL